MVAMETEHICIWCLMDTGQNIDCQTAQSTQNNHFMELGLAKVGMKC